MGEEKVAGLNIEVALDIARLKAATGEAVKSLGEIVTASTRLGSNIDPTERRIVSLASKINNLSAETATRKLNELAQAVEKAGGASVKGAAQVEFLQKRIEALSAAGGKVPASLEGLASSTNKVSSALQSLNMSGAATMAGLPPIFGRVAMAATSATGAIVGVGAAAIGIGVASTSTAMEFESAFARVKRTVTPAIADVGALRQGLIDMATVIPVSAIELSKIASMAGQMGITGTANILKFTETVARLGVTADMSAESAAQMLARIAQVNNIPMDKIENLSSMVLGVGARSNATTEEILRMTLQMQALGASAGLSAQDMIGLSATLASGGVRIESAGNAMGRMARDINSAVALGGPKLQELAYITKMTAAELQSAWSTDKAATLYAIFQGLHNQGDAATETLERMGWQGLRTAGSANVLSKTVDELKRNITEARTQFSDNTATMEQSGQIFSTTESSIKKLKGSFEALGIALGEGPAAGLKDIVDRLTAIIALANSNGLGTFLRALSSGPAGGTEYALRAAAGGVQDYVGGLYNSMTGHQSSRVENSPLGPHETDYLGFDPLSRGIKVAPDGSTGAFPDKKGGARPLSEEQDAAAEHYANIRIELEKQYQQALAKTKEGVDAVIDGIHAWAIAEKEKITKDKQVSPKEKEISLAKITSIEKLKIAKAESDEDQRIAKEKEKVQERMASFGLKIAKATETANAREGEGIQRVINALDAKVAGYQLELDMMTDLEPAQREAAQAQIDDYEKVAEAAALANHEMEKQVEGTADLVKAEKEYRSAIEASHPTLQNKLGMIQDEYNADVDVLNKRLRIDDISFENYKKEIAFLRAIKKLKEDTAKLNQTMTVLNGIATRMNTVAGLMQEVGGMTGNDTMERIGSATQKGSGIGGAVGSLFGPMGAIVGSIAGGLIGGIGSALFGKEAEFKTVMKEIGSSWGASISEGTAKAIADSKLGHKLGALLNINKIMADNVAVDPARFLPEISELMDAIEAGTIPAREGIESLGEAFNTLKTEAEGGSTASRNAMVAIIKQAKELGLAVPEIQAHIRASIDKAIASLADVFRGQGNTQRGGVVSGIGSAQADANIKIFNAVFDASVALDGLVVACDKNKEAFDELTRNLPAGTKLFGGAARMAEVVTLMGNSPMFKGAAQTGAAAGKVMGSLFDAGALNQETTDAFGVTLQNNMQQALDGTAGLDISDEERVRLAEEANLPLLMEMQHARASGLILSPEAGAMLDEAQRNGLLPALTIAEQSLQVQKDMLEALRGGKGPGGNPNTNTPGPPPPTNTTSTPGPGPAGGPPGNDTRTTHYAGGGVIPYTPNGGRYVIGGEKEDEYVFPKSQLPDPRGGSVPGGAGGSGGFSFSLGGIIITPQLGQDPVAIGESVVRALERDLVPRLRTVIREAVE